MSSSQQVCISWAIQECRAFVFSGAVQTSLHPQPGQGQDKNIITMRSFPTFQVTWYWYSASHLVRMRRKLRMMELKCFPQLRVMKQIGWTDEWHWRQASVLLALETWHVLKNKRGWTFVFYVAHNVLQHSSPGIKTSIMLTSCAWVYRSKISHPRHNQNSGCPWISKQSLSQSSQWQSVTVRNSQRQNQKIIRLRLSSCMVGMGSQLNTVARAASACCKRHLPKATQADDFDLTWSQHPLNLRTDTVELEQWNDKHLL